MPKRIVRAKFEPIWILTSPHTRCASHLSSLGSDPSDSSGSSFGPGRADRGFRTRSFPWHRSYPVRKASRVPICPTAWPTPFARCVAESHNRSRNATPGIVEATEGWGFIRRTRPPPSTRETKKPPSPDGGGGSVSIQRRPDGSGLVGARAGITSFPACHPFRPCHPCRACHHRRPRRASPACQRSWLPL